MGEIRKLLERDLYKNINMLYFMEDNLVHDLRRVGNSVILRGESDRKWTFISCSDGSDWGLILAELNDQDRCFAVIEDWIFSRITENRNCAWSLSTLRLVLPAGSEMCMDRYGNPEAAGWREETGPVPAYVRPLSEADIPVILENSEYRDYISADYIGMRIESGPSLGIVIEGFPVGWVLTHDDGAIGFMHIMQKFRKQGYAKRLMLHMIQLIRRCGRIPFVHIEETNTASMALAAKLGFQRDRLVHWFEIEA